MGRWQTPAIKMRDISAIRNKEQAIHLQSTTETRVFSTVNKKLKDQIGVQKKELDGLAETIQRNRQLASDEIEKVLKDAWVRAAKLISEAESTKYEANTFLKAQAYRKSKLDELEQEVSKREGEVTTKETEVVKTTQKIKKQEETAQKNLLLSDKRYQEAVEACISAVSLLSLAADHLENLRAIREEASEQIYQNVSQIGIIETRVIRLMKLVDSDRTQQQEKEIELKNKEILLKDRNQLFNRVETELRLKYEKNTTNSR